MTDKQIMTKNQLNSILNMLLNLTSTDEYFELIGGFRTEEDKKIVKAILDLEDVLRETILKEY